MQCVPSRSAMMVGLRTDQIEVYDNAIGIVSVNGDPAKPDPHCVAAFGAEACAKFADAQKAPATFIDLLDTNGYNVTLCGSEFLAAIRFLAGPVLASSLSPHNKQVLAHSCCQTPINR